MELGLADRLSEPETLLDDALALAGQMAANPSPMLRMTKQLLSANSCDTDTARIQAREHESLEVCYTLPEHKEAVAAFTEKRAPDFKAARAKVGG